MVPKIAHKSSGSYTDAFNGANAPDDNAGPFPKLKEQNRNVETI